MQGELRIDFPLGRVFPAKLRGRTRALVIVQETNARCSL